MISSSLNNIFTRKQFVFLESLFYFYYKYSFMINNWVLS